MCTKAHGCPGTQTHTQWAYQKFYIVFICAVFQMQYIPLGRTAFPMVSAYKLDQGSHLIPLKGHTHTHTKRPNNTGA